jgi:hypothetical protein
MAADTISGYIQGLLDGREFKQTAYALDRDSRKAALARFLKRASGGDPEEVEEERRLAPCRMTMPLTEPDHQVHWIGTHL